MDAAFGANIQRTGPALQDARRFQQFDEFVSRGVVPDDAAGVDRQPECEQVGGHATAAADPFLLFAGPQHRDWGLGARDSGLGTRGSGLGTRGSGLGTRDSGLGTRDSGLGTGDSILLGCLSDRNRVFCLTAHLNPWGQY